MPTAIILGGNADQVPLVHALAKRGYRTVLIDYYADPPGKAFADVHYQVSTLDVSAVCAVVEKERPAFLASIGNDLVVPMLADVSERFGLPCTQSRSNALKASNKQLMKAAFREHGIPTARQFGAEEYAPANRAALAFPVIGKLLVGYGARGVRRLNDAHELDRYLEEFAPQGEVLVEAFVEGGAELSVDCFVVDGRSSVLLISRLHQVPGLHAQFSNLMVEFPYGVASEVRTELEHIAQRMALAFGIVNGPFFFQAKLNGGVLNVIEMGARIAGGRKFSVIKATTGFDPLEAQLDVLEGKAPRVQVDTAERYHVTLMLFAHAGVVEKLSVPSHAGLLELYLVKAPGGTADGSATGGDRLAVMTVHAADRGSALKVMEDVLARTKALAPDGTDLLWHELYSGPW